MWLNNKWSAPLKLDTMVRVGKCIKNHKNETWTIYGCKRGTFIKLNNKPEKINPNPCGKPSFMKVDDKLLNNKKTTPE